MKKVYIYEDEQKNPVVTLCVMAGRDGAAVGVAVCSDDDEFDDYRGLNIACGRARKALKAKKSSGPIVREDVWAKLTNLREFWTRPYGFRYKSQYHSIV